MLLVLKCSVVSISVSVTFRAGNDHLWWSAALWKRWPLLRLLKSTEPLGLQGTCTREWFSALERWRFPLQFSPFSVFAPESPPPTQQLWVRRFSCARERHSTRSTAVAWFSFNSMLYKPIIRLWRGSKRQTEYWLSYRSSLFWLIYIFYNEW